MAGSRAHLASNSMTHSRDGSASVSSARSVVRKAGRKLWARNRTRERPARGSDVLAAVLAAAATADAVTAEALWVAAALALEVVAACGWRLSRL